jgi:hypothetical protein
MPTIKAQLRREIALRGKLKGKDKKDLKTISNEAGIDYVGFCQWYNDDDRGMSDKNIQKIVDVLGKRLVLIDKM